MHIFTWEKIRPIKTFNTVSLSQIYCHPKFYGYMGENTQFLSWVLNKLYDGSNIHVVINVLQNP